MADRVSSTQRALAILDCFSTGAPALTLSEIARRLRQPVSSTHRQVRELTEWGALERDETGRYSVGLHLWEVGSLAPRSKSLREASLPFLEDLYEATHENAQVAILDGSEVVYVERLYSHHATRIVARPGARLPLHATGVGRVLLAHAGAELINEVLNSPLQRFTKHTLVDPEQIRRDLATIRKTGYAICDRQVELVSTSVAAPIHGNTNDVVAALSINGPAGRLPKDRIRELVPLLLRSAAECSQLLGYRR